jgi:hypothetical protein
VVDQEEVIMVEVVELEDIEHLFQVELKLQFLIIQDKVFQLQLEQEEQEEVEM